MLIHLVRNRDRMVTKDEIVAAVWQGQAVWRDVPENAWRWRNFSPAEIACRGTDKLLALRDRLGKPLIVRSAYRSPEHNRAVGGATRSKHLDGAAFEEAAREVGFHPRSGFIHVDLGPERL